LSIGSIYDFTPEHRRRLALARRVTAIGMSINGSLSASKLVVGWIGRSTAVVADGLENAGDLLGSGLILYALHIASKPPDSDHPYGHGRSETIAGLAVGMLLAASGLAICYESVRRLQVRTELPQLYAIWRPNLNFPNDSPALTTIEAIMGHIAGAPHLWRTRGMTELKSCRA
jgi:divalent metal cation (Fe/Co/Zn/Cd) transporter